MEIGSLEMLSQQMIERWRRRRQAMPTQPVGAGGPTDKEVRLMMVQQVVMKDAVHGAHLLAGPVRFEGVPPVPRAGNGAMVRCYPTAGWAVEEYSVGEVVKVYCAVGANLAEKMV